MYNSAVQYMYTAVPLRKLKFTMCTVHNDSDTVDVHACKMDPCLETKVSIHIYKCILVDVWF